MPSIGHVSISKECVGLRLNIDGEVDGPVSPFFILWSVTFSNPSENGCEPGYWDNCPANIGDVKNSVVNSPSDIEVFEIRKGTAGNDLKDSVDLSNIDVLFMHRTQKTLAFKHMRCRHYPVLTLLKLC